MEQALKAAELPAPIPFERGTSRLRASRGWDLQDARRAGVQTALLDLAAEAAPLENSRRDECLYAVVRARELMHQLDPVGVGARDLRECLQIQLMALRREATRAGGERDTEMFDLVAHIVRECLPLLLKKDMRELTKSCARSAEEVQAAVDFVRKLDPRPGNATTSPKRGSLSRTSHL